MSWDDFVRADAAAEHVAEREFKREMHTPPAIVDAPLTPRQREMARHALGLPSKDHFTNRNHYCVSAECDGYEEWTDLVARGLAVKASGGKNWCGDFFYLTLRGARLALDPKEHISLEEAAAMRCREEVGAA